MNESEKLKIKPGYFLEYASDEGHDHKNPWCLTRDELENLINDEIKKGDHNE